MKIQNNKKDSSIKLLVIAGIAIVAIVGMIAFGDIVPPAKAQSTVTQNGNTSPQVVNISWPPTGWWTDGQQHAPLHTTVVIGMNNTIKWINDGQILEWITADNTDDQGFAKVAPYFISVSDLPPNYKVEKSTTIAGSEETEVHFTAPDTVEKSFFTIPMKFANNVLAPGKSFEYTFTHAGTFGYHDRAWERGYITVLGGGKSQ